MPQNIKDMVWPKTDFLRLNSSRSSASAGCKPSKHTHHQLISYTHLSTTQLRFHTNTNYTPCHRHGSLPPCCERGHKHDTNVSAA